MLDLGASINVMPCYVRLRCFYQISCQGLNLNKMEKTNVYIQLGLFGKKDL